MFYWILAFGEKENKFKIRRKNLNCVKKYKLQQKKNMQVPNAKYILQWCIEQYLTDEQKKEINDLLWLKTRRFSTFISTVKKFLNLEDLVEKPVNKLDYLVYNHLIYEKGFKDSKLLSRYYKEVMVIGCTNSSQYNFMKDTFEQNEPNGGVSKILYENHIKGTEKEGKYLIQKGIESLLLSKLQESYEYIIKGYKLITCDCILGLGYTNYTVNVLENRHSECESFKIDFLKAFSYFYSENYENALSSVNSYIYYKPDDEIGYYLKARILSSLNRFEEALLLYNQALILKKTSKVLYRIGRIKESQLNFFGIPELYEALLMNLSSSCAHWHFAELSLKRKLFQHDLPDYQSQFDKDFVFALRLGKELSKKFEEFGEAEIKDYLESIKEMMTFSSRIEIEEFYKRHPTSDYLDDEILDSFYLNDESSGNSNNDYDSDYGYDFSYEQFGGAHGYDDQTINTAFEGDPSNYWNID